MCIYERERAYLSFSLYPSDRIGRDLDDERQNQRYRARLLPLHAQLTFERSQERKEFLSLSFLISLGHGGRTFFFLLHFGIVFFLSFLLLTSEPNSIIVVVIIIKLEKEWWLSLRNNPSVSECSLLPCRGDTSRRRSRRKEREGRPCLLCYSPVEAGEIGHPSGRSVGRYTRQSSKAIERRRRTFFWIDYSSSYPRQSYRESFITPSGPKPERLNEPSLASIRDSA